MRFGHETADFRGEHGAIYNLVSGPGFAMNARIENATFTLHNATVHGTFFTEVYYVCQNHTAKHSAPAGIYNNWGYKSIAYTCRGETTRYMRPSRNSSCADEMAMTSEYASVTVQCNQYTARSTIRPVYNRIDGALRRMDFSIKGSMFTHGLVGQGFARPRAGKRDVYPTRGEFVTRAQAEGAIDGQGRDYIVKTPWSTEFAYSLFDSLVVDERPSTLSVGSDDA